MCNKVQSVNQPRFLYITIVVVCFLFFVFVCSCLYFGRCKRLNLFWHCSSNIINNRDWLLKSSHSYLTLLASFDFTSNCICCLCNALFFANNIWPVMLFCFCFFVLFLNSLENCEPVCFMQAENPSPDWNKSTLVYNVKREVGVRHFCRKRIRLSPRSTATYFWLTKACPNC